MADLIRENGYEYLGDGVYYRLLTAYDVEIRLEDPGTEIVLERPMLEHLLKMMGRPDEGTDHE